MVYFPPMRSYRVSRSLELLAVQAPPLPLGTPFAVFADQARAALAAHPGAELLVFPELHLFHAPHSDLAAANAALRAAAIPLYPVLSDPLDAALGALARELGVCLIPGTLCEAGGGEAGESGKLYNTARVYSPDGTVLASYRKVFPWRPSEPYDPGDSFVTFDLPGKGRIGLTICYDAWFPEVSRQVAWLGAEFIINLVKTTTPDRAQELVLARANAIVNQTFLLSLNCGGPVGMGQSLLVDPEGHVIAACESAAPALIRASIPLAQVDRIREQGTCGENRLWHQFTDKDQPIKLPSYQGAIDPKHWLPHVFPQLSPDQESPKA
jgi:predicted amidohydrolase